MPEGKSGKNRLHLDLIVDDLDAATAEIETLGGRWLDDPDGNEFDIDVLPPA